MNAAPHKGKPPRTRIGLGANEVAGMQGAGGTSIRCVRGLVWVTLEGDARDYLVSPGLCFVPARAGRIVINGMAADNVVEINFAAATETRIVPYQPLRIDWERFAQIEQAARRARAEYLATAARAALTAARRAWRHVLRRLAGAMSAAAIHKSGGRA
jgi:predicted nucleic acid-binding Zn finger protein